MHVIGGKEKTSGIRFPGVDSSRNKNDAQIE